jgi:hypothetical protein
MAFQKVFFYKKGFYEGVFIKNVFPQGPMNIIDMLAIIPFYLSLLLEGLEDFEIIGKAGKIVRLVKVKKKSEKERTVFWRLPFMNTTLLPTNNARTGSF